MRLVKAVLKRTFPKVDGAISLSQTQVMYLNDLSASVQLQLNQLRDGSATANNAVNSRFANSASVASNIGSIPAARVPDLAGTNTFTAQESLRLQHNGAFVSFYNTAGSARTGYLQMVAGDAAYLNVEQSLPFHVYTSNTPRMTIAANGAISFVGAVSGTISNATEASHAASASFATAAALATLATTAVSASSAALLSGLGPSELVFGNTIAQRNSDGDLFARYIRTQAAQTYDTPSIGGFMVVSALDGYHRLVTAALAGQYMEARNITGRTGTTKTLSSSSPSGGSNGDLWYQYV